jgi:hypothetical protein
MDCRVKPGKDERGALPLEHPETAVTYMLPQPKAHSVP